MHGHQVWRINNKQYKFKLIIWKRHILPLWKQRSWQGVGHECQDLFTGSIRIWSLTVSIRKEIKNYEEVHTGNSPEWLHQMIDSQVSLLPGDRDSYRGYLIYKWKVFYIFQADFSCIYWWSKKCKIVLYSKVWFLFENRGCISKS